MAEGLHRSSDVPNFDTYPSPSPEGHAAPIGVERSSERSSERRSLEQHAAELGAMAGKVVVMMRQTKENLENLSHHAIYDRVTELAENTKARAGQLSRLAGTRAQELSQSAQVKAAEFRRQASEKSAEFARLASEKSAELARRAKTGYHQVNHNAKRTARKYPIHVALAAGAVGLFIGMALRVRRARRAY